MGDDLKNSEGQSADAVKKIEETVSKTTKQIKQLADEIDLVEGGKQALGAVGDVLETGIDKAVDANKEYKLTERAAGAAKKVLETGIDKAVDANKEYNLTERAAGAAKKAIEKATESK